MIDDTFADLAAAGCVEVTGDAVKATAAGQVASYYYLDYRSVGVVRAGLLARGSGARLEPRELLRVLADVWEFAELPVRHNEEGLNAGLARRLPWRVDAATLDSPHTKAFLLLQAHLARCPLPISDYINDTKSVLDQVHATSMFFAFI